MNIRQRIMIGNLLGLVGIPTAFYGLFRMAQALFFIQDKTVMLSVGNNAQTYLITAMAMLLIATFLFPNKKEIDEYNRQHPPADHQPPGEPPKT